MARIVKFNLDVAHVLSARFKFKAIYFLQPTLPVGDKPLTNAEQRIAESIDPELAAALRLMYERLTRHDAPTILRDLSGAFAGIQDPVWIDGVHLSPRGNERIAAAMLDAVLGRDGSPP